MKVALANPNVIAFKTQDLSDRYSWVYRPDPWGAPDYGYPDMLDKDYQPKPAYTAVLNALKNVINQERKHLRSTKLIPSKLLSICILEGPGELFAITHGQRFHSSIF